MSPKIGEVGYIFTKYFPNHGFFEGKVVKIRPNAAKGKDRRCVYTDGDVEDLSMNELIALSQDSRNINAINSNQNHIEPPKVEPPTLKATIDKNRSLPSTFNLKTDAKTKDLTISRSPTDDSKLSKFSPLKWEVPIDKAAETTLLSGADAAAENSCESLASTESDDDVYSNEKVTDSWLEKVASTFVNTKRKMTAVTGLSKRRHLTTAISTSLTSQTRDSDPTASNLGLISELSGDSLSCAHKSKKICIMEPVLVSLIDLSPGSRFGVKVFHIDDETRLVGETLVESRGWIEASFDKSMRKGRTSQFVVAPSQYTVGDHVDKKLRLPRITKPPSPSVPIRRLNSCGSDYSVASSKNNSQIDRRTSPTSLDGSPHVISESPTKKEKHISSEDLFYWLCEKCSVASYYDENICSGCSSSRTMSSPKSALLDIASCVAFNSSSIEMARELLPITDCYAIPNETLQQLMDIQKMPSKKCLSLCASTPRNSPLYKKDMVFYWICAHCTVVNSYEKLKCQTCLKWRTDSALTSTLLKIAEDAAKWARTAEDAMSSVHQLHRKAMPLDVLSSLIMCVAYANKERRCSKPKLFGSDYCEDHNERKGLCFAENCGPCSDTEGKESASTSAAVCKLQKPMSTQAHNCEKGCSESEASLVSLILDSISHNLGGSLKNLKLWRIRDVEDSIFCDDSGPFPLGMIVRRFFPRYGFHDGRVVQVRRKIIADKASGHRRPVLLYRVKYDDGDEEDVMHHEISSLRQLFDLRNVDSTAPPCCQIVPGTVAICHKQGIAIIIQHITDPNAAHPDEGGLVRIKFSRQGRPWSEVELKLIDLQLNVIRALTRHDSILVNGEDAGSWEDAIRSGGWINTDDAQMNVFDLTRFCSVSCDKHSPVIEWPTRNCQPSQRKSNSLESESCPTAKEIPPSDELKLAPGLFLVSKRDESKIEAQPALSTFDCSEDSSFCNDRSSIRKGVDEGLLWDPASIAPFISWDPYGHIVCEICSLDTDDHQILICDECILGFHMYCVRPVIVNVPTGIWKCPRCSPSRSFYDRVNECKNNLSLVTEYLKLPFVEPSQFHETYQRDIDIILLPKLQRHAKFPRKLPSHQTGSLYFSHHVEATDWLLPVPLASRNEYNDSLISMVAGMKYCGMTDYSEDLVYDVDTGVTESMNDASLEQIDRMSQRNLEIFKEFKHNMRAGLYPPIRLVYEQNVGLSVEAIVSIPKHTLITEYVGCVTTVAQSGETSSDSLMILLDTGDVKTSLVIDPSRCGNIARFLSGVNNASQRSLRKVNVRTRRFEVNGRCRVALFTSRKVAAGEKLCYDYNAGMEGRDLAEWAKNGFYDTSNFI